MAEHSPIDRRSFLVRRHQGRYWSWAGRQDAPPGDVNWPSPRRRGQPAWAASVATQPLIPPNFARYVSRPDLTPVAVAVNATPDFLALGSKPGYIFCAPKAPVAANPGKWDAGRSRVLPVRRHPGPDDIGHARRAGLVQAAARAR